MDKTDRRSWWRRAIFVVLLPIFWILGLTDAYKSRAGTAGSGPSTSARLAGGGVSSRRAADRAPQTAAEVENAQLQAIADSLVTRAEPGNDVQGSTEALSGLGRKGPRRSVRIRSQEEERTALDLIKSPTSSDAPPIVDVRARQRAIGLRSIVPSGASRKTLILDLDETLIHSVSKGGAMSAGHMVEVRLGQHAILYYVHKRPHCDLFLQRVSRWYDVVVFTASIQEYADPVIDWLEQEQKFFKARYYRQHCTYRFGAYMKDLSVVQGDLSQAIIVDNSPLSYRLNEANAVPIEGWINDPSDNDLLYLIPLLQGLRTIDDVRSLLSLRGS